MATNLASTLNLLAVPPGDLVYHLATIITLIILIAVLIIKFKGDLLKVQGRFFFIGCFILLLIQISLFVFRLINLKTGFARAEFLPTYERLAASLTIMWLIWAFFAKSEQKFYTIFFTCLSLILSILAILWVIYKPHLATIPFFNPITINILWQLIALAIIILGLILALTARLPMMKVLVFVLLLLACGHLFQIFMINEQHLMGSVRLGQILALLWLLTVIKHFSSDDIKTYQSSASVKRPSPRMTHDESTRPDTKGIADTKPSLVNLLLKINTAQNQEEKNQTLAQALSLSVIADICFLVSIPKESEKIYILSGYDLIRETHLKTDTLAREDIPHIIAAWENQQIFTLTNDDAHHRDAQTLAMLLNYHTIGNLLAYPLGLPDNPLLGGIFFLSPYTGKRWCEKTFQLMNQVKDTLSIILFAPDALEEANLATSQAKSKINSLIDTTGQLRATLIEMETQIQKKDTFIKGLKAKYQIDRMAIITELEQLRQKVSDLNAQIAIQPDYSSKFEQLQNENQQLLEERNQLHLELNRAKNRLQDLQTEIGQTGPIRLSLESQIISLDSIAANARLGVASQLSKHKIDLEIQNPDGRLLVKTDPELLHTALHELLINAILASGRGGTIRLEQKLTLEMGMLTVQVTDFGKGLTPAEQTALFSAQHKTIPGIGSVSSVRNAIRAIRVLNGKIWLKSKKVSYTTFRFQIPVRIID